MNYSQEWFHFYAILKPKGKLCLRRSISFFNELDIEWELCSKASVSFFNELDTVESPDLLAGIFHLLRTARCSTGLNGSYLEQMKDRG